jgi:hypothetical protein
MLNDILVSIIGGAILLLIVAIFTFMRMNLFKKFRKARIMLSTIFSNNNMFFYMNRKQQGKILGTIGEYILTAKHDLAYIGYWLSSLNANTTDIEKSIEELIDKNISFEVHLINPNNDYLIHLYSDFFNLTEDELKNKINNTIGTLKRIKGIVKYPDNMKIYLHNSFLHASCFIFDKKLEKCKILIDHKIPTTSRAYSYGFELINKNSEFQKNVIDNYEKITKKSIEIK